MQLNQSTVSKRLQKWYRLEQECDTYNYQSFLNMEDKSHINKTKLKSFNAAIKRWYKETSKQFTNVSKLTFTTNKTYDHIRD